MYFLLLIPFSRTCEYQVSFTDCLADTRTAIVYNYDCSEISPKIVQNLPCNFSCLPGFRLDYNLTSNSLYCSPCPGGTYAIGGGDEYSSWNRFRDIFQSRCLVLQPFGWEQDKNCTGWHADSDAYLVTGAGEKNKQYKADLFLYVVLVKPGYFEVEYRKEIGENSVEETGEFYIDVNSTNYYSDLMLRDNWMTTKLSLGVGTHKIQIRYSRFINDENNYAMIRKIVVQGTKFADFSCEICEKGNSMAATDKCVICEIGYYFEVSIRKCLKCDIGFSSSLGSVGRNGCYKLKPCKENWHYYYSDCEEGKQLKVYEWNSPLNCDNENMKLPNTEIIDCVPCGPGKFYKNKVCQYCPEGTFNYQDEFGSTCTECGAGKYAEKVSDFSQWTVIPEDFRTLCLVNNSICGYDWETRGTYIETSPIYYPDSQIIFEGSFEITEKNASTEFSFKTQGKNSKFSFYINGKEQMTVTGNHEADLGFGLVKGMNLLKWVYFHKGLEDERCEIRRVTVYGSLFGGASGCLNCSQGSVSSGKQEGCTECESGKTSNGNKTSCISCETGQYVSFNKICEFCVENLTPCSQGTYCQLKSKSLIFQNSAFIINDLAGSPGSPPAYCSESKLKMYCFETFYGPVKGGSHYFYLSVLNPSSVGMASFTEIFKGHAYAFAIIDIDQFEIPQVSLNRSDICNFTHNKVVANLGREVQEISEFFIGNDSGFIVKYNNGDLCRDKKRFSTVLKFVCSKEEVEGWPVFEDFQDCTFYFYWPTVHACRICTNRDWIVHNETCEEGVKLIHLFEGEKCVFENRTSHVEITGICAGLSIYKTWPFVFSMFLCSILLIIVSGAVIMALRKRNGYKRLAEKRSKSEDLDQSSSVIKELKR